MSRSSEAPRGCRFSCGAAARWLPRCLAGSLVAATALIGLDLGSSTDFPGARRFALLLGVAGLLAALWFLRSGAQLRTSVEVAGDGLIFRFRAGERKLLFDRVEAIAYHAPFSSTRDWVPALVLLGERGEAWRIPALLDRGGRLLDEIVSRSGRSDLAAWIETRRIKPKMERVRFRLALGYTAAALPSAVAIALVLR